MGISTFKSLIQSVQDLGWQAALRAVQYNNNLRTLDRRFSTKKPRGRFQTLGRVTAVEPQARGALVQTERGFIELHFITPGVLRVRLQTTPEFSPPFSYAMDKSDWPSVASRVQHNAHHSLLHTDQLNCEIERNTGKLTITTTSGRVISKDADGISWRDTEVRWSRYLPPAEHVYGLGQRASKLDLHGQHLALWNTDPLPGYDHGDDPIYYSIPFYLGVQSSHAVGILWDNPARGSIDLGANHDDTMTFAAESGELKFYIFAGDTVEDVLKTYTALTGRAPLPPLWALGYHQARWGYDSEQAYRNLAREFRSRELPCDAFYFDIDTMDNYRVFTWDRTRFPLLPVLLKELETQGFKAVALLNPGVKVDDDYPVYQDGVRRNVFLTYPDQEPVIAPVWPGKCQFPDFTSAHARSWWSEQIPTLVRAGFAGYWNDMNEPTIITMQRGATLPDYVVHDWAGIGNTHAGGGHNVYGMLMAKATREGLAKARPDKRPFVMTRATYAGGQRYASSWIGGNEASWEHLRLSISMVLNAGLSGIAFTGPDIGGFAGEPDGELFTRWMQASCLMPYFRSNSMSGTKPQEPWQFGERYETIIRRAIRLRYQLLPYLYSAFAHYSQTGAPIVRPLFMADPTDQNLYEVNDAFMLGDSILVAPVVEPGATRRDIVLPRGVWYEYDTGRLIDGARTISAEAALDRLPLYVRAGKVIPLWPSMQYVGERPITEAHLRVYAGNGDTTLYEDAGEGLSYQHGEFRWSYFTCKFLPSGQFAIDWRRAGQYEPPYKQARVEIVGISAEPEMVQMDGHAAPIWYYEGGLVEFVVKPFAEARIIGHDPSTSEAGATRVHKPRS